MRASRDAQFSDARAGAPPGTVSQRVPTRRRCAARYAAPRARTKLAAGTDFIDAILEADRKAPRKQRHTAYRIWCRLVEELPQLGVAESTVLQYVRLRKQELGLSRAEIFVPQSYHWGQEAQVDWYEAYADIEGERQKVYLFCMRSMAGGGGFHRAYPHASQQAFLEAHEWAFARFGGVFARLRYDNLGRYYELSEPAAKRIP